MKIKKQLKGKKRQPFETEILWAVMKACAWDSLTVNGVPLINPTQGPEYFMPLFKNREQAVAFNGGSEDRVKEIYVR